MSPQRAMCRLLQVHQNIFVITVGFPQASALYLLLFILIINTVAGDLHNDVMIASESKADLECQAQAWSDCLARFGLRLNVRKTEYLTTDPNECGTIKIDGIDLPITEEFKYFSAQITADGSLYCKVTSRINSAWCTASAVMCDKKISDCLKSKSYCTIV
ncbi:hypothetical protein JRQ81_016504 [Phrynocephalus forsythii]|uniref:Uncharacterized protein n=1 Tax=Phrynocephalus forsythii TaxID=171643 RepID=A0A9Q0XUW1_9SAUR|nr:hypothetical protein JRQ81_016504 [Phrynocephalus forsythii]